MENGKMIQEIYNTVIRLDERTLATDEKLDKITEFMEPEGICERARTRINRVYGQVKFQWFLIALIVVSIIGGAFKILYKG